MADLNGINTQNSQAAIRATIYSGMLREALEPELVAMNYVDVISDFPFKSPVNPSFKTTTAGI